MPSTVTQFRKGNIGRPKGSRNKLQTQVREMILMALDDVGGQAYLARQAEENPTAFLALLGKILPREVEANMSGLTIQWPLPRNVLDA